MSEFLRNVVPFLLVALALVWIITYGRQRAEKAQKSEAALSRDELDQRQRLQRAMEQLQVNIMEFGRDVEGRLDTRIATLGRLVQDADERIKRLEELTSQATRGAHAMPPLYREIYRLADEGLDKVEIARRTGTAPGEIELILSLRKDRSAG